VTLDEQVSYYAQHTDADPTRRSYSIGDQACVRGGPAGPSAGRVAVDIETAGLGDLAFKVKVIIIATAQRSCVLDATDPKHRAAAREAIGAARELVFHNSCFDVPPLINAGIMRIEDIAKVYDTIIYSRMAFTGEMDRHPRRAGEEVPGQVPAHTEQGQPGRVGQGQPDDQVEGLRGRPIRRPGLRHVRRLGRDPHLDGARARPSRSPPPAHQPSLRSLRRGPGAGRVPHGARAAGQPDHAAPLGPRDPARRRASGAASRSGCGCR
jgi:hypothetical protein